ncbi:MAG: UDP-4-amino-4,6-dideoxy-N-acetyl-beta-L-altrosamine transaminase [Syntrophomonadaceae bacterium]|nr:UDP-4-amino-4,6-dideoxy-N-acetyl-beta-L-altrosamine transaminase [Syntrophomonadaceae bacterium]
MKPIIFYAQQYIDEEDIKSVIKILQGNYLTTGPYINKFEQEFAKKVGAKYAVAVSSGTAALHIANLAADIGQGDEIITTPMTFAATANAALYVGAKPVFVDIDNETYNINVREIEQRITDKTKAIVPVHYTGLPCDMEVIHSIAKKYDLIVIEDACHALGARYKGSTIGDSTYSNMTIFSFHPVKHITTGEGGMITTNSKELYDKLIKLRSHGIVRDENNLQEASHGDWYYEMQLLGFNYRMTDIQAALGMSQLKKLDYFIKRRREIVEKYNDAFKSLPIKLPFEPEDYYNAYHLYVIKINDDNKANQRNLYCKLKQKGINTQVHYIPVHTMPYYQKNLGYKWGDYPVAEDHYRRVLSIPLYPAMTDEQVEYVIKCVKEVLI